jgi:hypothetical protein
VSVLTEREGHDAREGTASTARRRRWIRFTIIGVVFVVAVLVVYRPTPSSLTSTLPSNLGDPALNTWILAWENHALFHTPGQFFAGNIFYPFGDSILYSEMMLPLVPLFGAIYWISGNPVLAHNVLILLLALFSLVTTYALAKRILGRDDVAVISALAFSFTGFVLMHQGHLQLLTIGFFPLAFLTLFSALERPTVRRGILLGLTTFLLVAACLYYGAIWVVCLAVVLAAELVAARGRPGRRWWNAVAAAGVTGLVLLVPILSNYVWFQHETGFFRPLDASYGLNPRDLLTPAPGSNAYGWLLDWAGKDQPDIVEHGFFIGFVTAALCIVGAVVLIRSGRGRRERAAGATRREAVARTVDRSIRWRELWLLVLCSAASLLLAVGPTVLGVPMPFRFFHDYVPGFDGIKATSRLAVPAVLTATILAGLGLHWLARHRSPAVRLALVAAAGVLVLIELSADPLRASTDRPAEAVAVYKALAARPGGAVVELPIRSYGAGTPVSFLEGPRMLASIGDWRQRVNGFSGAFPSPYFDQAQVLNHFPEPAAVAAMQAIRIKYVVLHTRDTADQWSYSDAGVQRILSQLPAGYTAAQYGTAWLVTAP